MAIRPIIFSGPMVQAILDGRKTHPRRRKTQTRRVLNPQIVCHASEIPTFTWGKWSGLFPDDWFGYGNEIDGHLPYVPGDRLWVREAWKAWAEFDDRPPSRIPRSAQVQYLADMPLSEWDSRYRHAQFMPRWASRITLLVTDVRVQRLQTISEEDAVAEGLEWSWTLLHNKNWKDYRSPCGCWVCDPIASFKTLWDSLHEKSGDTWDTNPWVAAISFEPIFKNIDKVGK